MDATSGTSRIPFQLICWAVFPSKIVLNMRRWRVARSFFGHLAFHPIVWQIQFKDRMSLDSVGVLLTTASNAHTLKWANKRRKC